MSTNENAVQAGGPGTAQNTIDAEPGKRTTRDASSQYQEDAYWDDAPTRKATGTLDSWLTGGVVIDMDEVRRMADEQLKRWAAKPQPALTLINSATGVAKFPNTLPFERADRMRVDLNTQWLVTDLLPARGLGLIFGGYSVGKTFVTLDLAMTVARAERWHGLEVERPGAVLYIATEGRLEPRVEAYRLHHDTGSEPLHVYISQCGVNLYRDEVDARRIRDTIEELTLQTGLEVVWVIVDTVAKAMPGGDESSAKDMGLFVENLQKIERAAECLVTGVHHAGKDESKGSRGSTALPAGVDVSLVVRETKRGREVAIDKLRDGDDTRKFGFRLEVVELGKTEKQIMRTSCVVVPSVIQSAPGPQFTEQAQAVLGIIRANPEGIGRRALNRKYRDAVDCTADTALKAVNRAISELVAVEAIEADAGLKVIRPGRDPFAS
jgi:hypothetical protein